jgi:ABC-type transport system substrate-binding protein
MKFTRSIYFLLIALSLAACVSGPVGESSPVTIVREVTRVVTATATAPREPTAIIPDPPYADARVRRAIAHCTDRIALIESVYPGLIEPALIEMDSFVPSDHWAYSGDDSGFVRYEFDPDKGRALLDEAGWQLANDGPYRTNRYGEELDLKLTTTSSTFRQAWAGVFEEQMKECGIRIVRLHTPSAWLFGQTTGLQRRDFELAAFAWVFGSDPGGRTEYTCDQIPSQDNDWQGQNYTGWCNPTAHAAIVSAATQLRREDRRESYRRFQQAFTADVPSIPLFQRLALYAINPALQGFVPSPSEYYTWNAHEWAIPGQDTIVIGMAHEPASLLITETSSESRLVQSLVYGFDYTMLDYEYQPMTLLNFPNVDSNDVLFATVEAREGDSVVDTSGRMVKLAEGVRVFHAQGETEFGLGPVWVSQLTVTYDFTPGLRWSDGESVTKEDYQLAYRLTCDPETTPPPLADMFHYCRNVAGVNFLNDSTFAVTWLPGFRGPNFFLPPFGRLPAHEYLSDGRQLAEAPFEEWARIPEIAETPLGIGPYVVNRWARGESIHLTANPYYFAGQPATPNIVVRFFESPEAAIEAMLAGEVDVLGPETLDATEHGQRLIEANEARKVTTFVLPHDAYEHIDFNLSPP